jgi:hypothetical protein
MTQTEFFAYANLDDYADNVNIWYTGSNPGTILGLSIPVLAQGQNITAKLQEVQQITIPQPSGLPVILTVTSRSQNQSPNGTRYYIFLVEQVSTQDITGPIAVGQLYFSPDIDVFEFSISPYNVLGGTVEENRESTYIMKADKSVEGSTTVPVGYSGPANIYALLSGSAELAIIQDSNYSITGWTNARYFGSKTNESDYKSPPSVTGTVFKGSNYPTTVPEQHIQNQISSSDVIYSDYFYAGTDETPGYSTSPLLFETSGSSVSPTSTDFFIKQTVFNPDSLIGSITIGDLITVGTAYEVMRVTLLGVPPGLAPGTLRVRVDRNTNNVPSQDLANVNTGNQPISSIKQVQIYEIDRNRLNGVVRGFMVVQLTGEILKLSSNGFVVGKVE